MKTSGLVESVRVAMWEYDFAKHGGAVGDISVPGDVIMNGAIIIDGLIHVKTAFVGATATIAVKALSANDIKAATAVASFSLNALLPIVPVGSAATAIRVTSNITALTFTVAVAPLTAGKAVVAIQYLPPTV